MSMSWLKPHNLEIESNMLERAFNIFAHRLLRRYVIGSLRSLKKVEISIRLSVLLRRCLLQKLINLKEALIIWIQVTETINFKNQNTHRKTISNQIIYSYQKNMREIIFRRSSTVFKTESKSIDNSRKMTPTTLKNIYIIIL